MNASESFDALGMSRSDAARALVDRAMAEHFNGIALMHLLRAFMVAHDAGKTALFIAVAERITDRPDLTAASRVDDPGATLRNIQA